MRRNFRLVSLVLILHPSAFILIAMPAMAENVRVFILAGQSNMDGRGEKIELTGELAAWAKPQNDVRISYSNSTMRGPYTTAGFVTLEPGFSEPPGTKERYGDHYKLPAETFWAEGAFRGAGGERESGV